MNLTRRHILKLLGVGAVVAAAGLGWRRWVWPGRSDSPLDVDEQAWVSAYVDTLVPTDDLGPGALALGIDAKVLRELERSPAARRLLRAGARRGPGGLPLGLRPLTGLSAAARETVIADAAAADPASASFKLFHLLRRSTFKHFYADDRSWAIPCYSGPPQPLGFPDHHRPPRPCA